MRKLFRDFGLAGAAFSTMLLGACASTPNPASAMIIGDRAAPPLGYIEYCARRPQDCAPQAAADGPELPLNAEVLGLLNDVNHAVNRAIGRRSDLAAYGKEEFWGTPLRDGLGRGDCEDYVLEKRRALLAAGLPEHALSIAVVTTPKGRGHAVLLVETASGSLVLDNLTPWIVPWSSTAYRWHARQLRGAGSPSMRIREAAAPDSQAATLPTAAQ